MPGDSALPSVTDHGAADLICSRAATLGGDAVRAELTGADAVRVGQTGADVLRTGQTGAGAARVDTTTVAASVAVKGAR
jgi:hypothetical protein